MINKTIGVILLLAGIALIIWGYDVYDSTGAQISRTFGGETPIEAWLGMIGGGICVILGIRQLK